MKICQIISIFIISNHGHLSELLKYHFKLAELNYFQGLLFAQILSPYKSVIPIDFTTDFDSHASINHPVIQTVTFANCTSSI